MVEREIQEHITVWRAPLDRNGERTVIVTLTKRGRELLESHRSRHSESSQTFFAGAAKSRELSHDAQLCRAYMRAAEKLRAQGARVQRVVLDYELKREYQTFLQERNRARAESDGPTRSLPRRNQAVGDRARPADRERPRPVLPEHRHRLSVAAHIGKRDPRDDATRTD